MTSFPAAASQTAPAPAAGPLPPAGRVLAVTARPGQESAELGGLLFAFRRAGASLGLLSLTRGEASPLNGAWVIDLGADAGTARTIQKAAVAAHASQSEALSRLTRRLDCWTAGNMCAGWSHDTSAQPVAATTKPPES